MNQNGQKSYLKLHELSKSISTLSSIHMLLEWDQETYMPQAAIDFRSSQIEAMASICHKMKTSQQYAKALGNLIDIKSGEILADKLDQRQAAALREWRRDYMHFVKLPPSFVKKFSQLTSQSIHVWAEAKKHDDFKKFAPYLEKIVNLCKKKADYLGYVEHPYDALLDLYEPGMKTSYLSQLFSKLQFSLTHLLQTIANKPKIPRDFLFGHFDPVKQNHFAHQLLKAMGFDPASSRLDLSNHPFCVGINPLDTRMTTRIHPDYAMSNFFSVIHEGGHGLYNMGLPKEHFGSPLGEPISIALDESQSRMWETIIGHSMPFWQYFYPKLQALFPDAFGAVALEEFYAAINTIQPSLIRVESDETTYSLHIIVRFEIEKMLIEESLKVKDLPDAWQEKMRKYLGVSPSTNAEGCMQDIHWSMGGIGYFPTYALGNLHAAQFFQKFERDHPEWKTKVSGGDLLFIKKWLNENIHRYGRQFTPDEMCIKVTGKTVDEQAFLDYLTHKYKGLYRT